MRKLLLKSFLNLSIMIGVSLGGTILIVFPDVLYSDTILVWIACFSALWIYLGALVGVPLVGFLCCVIVWPVLLAWVSLRSRREANACILLNLLVAVVSCLLVRFKLIDGMFI